MTSKTASHENFFAVSQCFCCFKNLIRDILIEKNEHRLLLALNLSNFNDLSDNEVFNKLFWLK